MGQLETSLLQETVYSLKFSLESQRLCSCHCSRDSRELRFTVGVTAQMLVLYCFLCMRIGVWVSQHRTWFVTMFCRFFIQAVFCRSLKDTEPPVEAVHVLWLHQFPTPPLYKRISGARALQLTGHATVSPTTWQQRSLPSGMDFSANRIFSEHSFKM